MTRFVSSTNEAEAALPALCMVTLAALDFTSGVVRLHDGPGELSFGGNAYLGVGRFGGIEELSDSLDTIARPVTLSLSGDDAAFVALARDEVYQGRPVTIYVGMLNGSTMQFVATPEELWSGFMNTMTLEAAPRSGKITLICESEFRFGASSAYYTNESAQIRNSAEKGFEFTKDIQGFKTSWGEKSTSFTGQGSIPSINPYADRRFLR